MDQFWRSGECQSAGNRVTRRLLSPGYTVGATSGSGPLRSVVMQTVPKASEDITRSLQAKVQGDISRG